MTKTIVALYDDSTTAQRVVQDLVGAGFSRDNISLVANDVSGEYNRRYGTTDAAYDDEDVKADEGAGFGAVVGTLVGLGVALIPGIGPVFAAGPFAAALIAGIGAAAGAITGGVVAGLVDFGIPPEEAEVYAEGLRRGGTLVSVSVDDEYAARVEEILNRYNPIDLDHRAGFWRDAGWDTFNPDYTPMSEGDISREREGYRDYVTGQFYRDSNDSTTTGDLDDTYDEDAEADRLENRQTYSTYGAGAATPGGRARSYPSDRTRGS